MSNSILSEAEKLNQSERETKRQNELKEAKMDTEMRRMLGSVYDPPEIDLDDEQHRIISEVVNAIPASEWIDDAKTEIKFAFLNTEIVGSYGVFTMYKWSDGSIHMRRRRFGYGDDIIQRVMEALPPEYDEHRNVQVDKSYGGNIIDTLLTKIHNVKVSKSAKILREAILERLKNYPIFGSRKYIRIWYYYDSDFVDKANFFAERKDTDFQYVHSHSTLVFILFDDRHIFNLSNHGFPLRETWVELVRQLRR
jgi:hypothetical protein